jgi:hypothetical protein
MALTDVAIRNAKPGAKAIKLADGGGMFLDHARRRQALAAQIPD